MDRVVARARGVCRMCAGGEDDGRRDVDGVQGKRGERVRAGARLLLLVSAAVVDLPTPTRGKNTAWPRRRPSTPFSVDLCASRGGCLGGVAHTRARKHAHTRACTHTRNAHARNAYARNTHARNALNARVHTHARSHTHTHARAHAHLRVGGISLPPIRVHGAARAAPHGNSRCAYRTRGRHCT